MTVCFVVYVAQVAVFPINSRVGPISGFKPLTKAVLVLNSSATASTRTFEKESKNKNL